MALNMKLAYVVISFAMLLAPVSACAPATPTAAPTKPAAAPAAGAAGATAAPTPASASAAPTAAPAATPSPAVKVKRGGILRDVQRLAIDMLDPHLATTRAAEFMPMLFDTLLSYQMVDPQTKKFEVGPSLAESFKVVDPTTIEFKLRKGVKFHDGTDFNAAVAKWNLDRAATHPKSKIKETMVDVKDVQVVDDYTLRVNLKQPSALFPLQMTPANPVFVGMLSKDAMDKMGEEKFANSPVGSGPMKFKEWIRDDRVTLEKFPGHWEKGLDGQALPYLDGMVSRLITDQSVALLEMRTGNVDTFLNVELKDVASVKSSQELSIQEIPLEWTAYPAFYFNPKTDTQYPFSNDKRLRQAAQYATDRDSMAKALGFGLAKPDYYPYWYPGLPGYDETLPKYEFNLDKAKQLMAEAGYANGIDLDVRIINRPIDARPVEMLQGMWSKIGIRLKISVSDRLPWVDDARTGRFEAASHANTSRPDPYLGQETRTGSSYNWPGYSRPEMDALWKQVGGEYDAAKRAELYKQIQKKVYEDAYHVFGYMYQSVAAINNKVKNLTSWYNYRYIWME
ncbi:MAG: ABC transporter substrate-binding protein [Chloroflexi bacterium]|nr:ABC transporter substrate-binding protein [Chloroflexota bacterium]MCL5026005.1 ABC transporter substrate-binding protein [Chloroflexota bacterium]